MEFRPYFEETESYEAVGYTWRGSDSSQIPPLWGHFDDRLGRLVDKSPSLLTFGICKDMDDAGVFSYMVGIMKGPEMNVLEGLEVWEVPGGRWAVFSTQLSNIHACFDYIMSTWIKESGVVMREGPMVERYPAGFNGQPHEYLEVLAPIS